MDQLHKRFTDEQVRKDHLNNIHRVYRRHAQCNQGSLLWAFPKAYLCCRMGGKVSPRIL